METSTVLERVQRGSSVLYGACGGIWVMTLFARPTEGDMRLARPALEAMSRAHPAGFPTLTWVLPEAGYSMDNDARIAAAEVTQAFERAILAQATLIEGTGFQAATVRAIVAGLDLMSRTSGARKVFSDLTAAVEWCVARRPPAARTGPPPADVASALVSMRRSLAAPG